MFSISRFFKKRKKEKKPIWIQEYSVLADYNREVSMGIVHTKEWDDYMKKVGKVYLKDYYEPMKKFL